MALTERVYQAKLIEKIKLRMPECVVIKNDPNYQQGFPDLTILFDHMWAMLEVKASATSPVQPNQEYFIRELNRQSWASFIYPEIEDEVLDALQQAFESRR